ncbi:MAG: hypothetical protein IKN73_03555 [Alphaproteobacteria bacterium]|nr:hypothetical protein [Alphaproteobacteria bacterium]
MTKTERIENIVKKLKTRKSKGIIYTIVIFCVAALFGYRFYAVSQENNFEVFNIIRDNMENGLPVEVLNMEKTDGVLMEPLTVKNNTAYVSGARIKYFKSGQKMDNCKIVSVSSEIDLDSGMYVIKTDKCVDGLHYAENKKNGFYVPVSAIRGNSVYVVNNGVAQIRDIVIDNRDAQNVLIKSGLESGDIVILSNVQNNQKIKIINK